MGNKQTKNKLSLSSQKLARREARFSVRYDIRSDDVWMPNVTHYSPHSENSSVKRP